MIARLQFGPFDGSRDEIEEAGAEAYAWRCPDCKNVHLTMAPVPKRLRVWLQTQGLKLIFYRLVKVDDEGALYRYGDLGDDLPRQKESERNPDPIAA